MIGCFFSVTLLLLLLLSLTALPSSAHVQSHLRLSSFASRVPELFQMLSVMFHGDELHDWSCWSFNLRVSDADTQQTGPSWICKSVVMVPMSLLRSKYHRFYHETVNVRPRRRYYTCTLAGMTGSITVVNITRITGTENYDWNRSSCWNIYSIQRQAACYRH